MMRISILNPMTIRSLTSYRPFSIDRHHEISIGHDEDKPIPQIQTKPAQSNVIDVLSASWLKPQTHLATELTASNLEEHNNLHDSLSKNYISTFTTTTASFDEYQCINLSHWKKKTST